MKPLTRQQQSEWVRERERGEQREVIYLRARYDGLESPKGDSRVCDPQELRTRAQIAPVRRNLSNVVRPVD